MDEHTVRDHVFRWGYDLYAVKYFDRVMSCNIHPAQKDTTANWASAIADKTADIVPGNVTD